MLLRSVLSVPGLYLFTEIKFLVGLPVLLLVGSERIHL
jgi:hypothetical protein